MPDVRHTAKKAGGVRTPGESEQARAEREAARSAAKQKANEELRQKWEALMPIFSAEGNFLLKVGLPAGARRGSDVDAHVKHTTSGKVLQLVLPWAFARGVLGRHVLEHILRCPGTLVNKAELELFGLTESVTDTNTYTSCDPALGDMLAVRKEKNANAFTGVWREGSKRVEAQVFLYSLSIEEVVDNRVVPHGSLCSTLAKLYNNDRVLYYQRVGNWCIKNAGRDYNLSTVRSRKENADLLQFHIRRSDVMYKEDSGDDCLITSLCNAANLMGAREVAEELWAEQRKRQNEWKFEKLLPQNINALANLNKFAISVGGLVLQKRPALTELTFEGLLLQPPGCFVVVLQSTETAGTKHAVAVCTSVNVVADAVERRLLRLCQDALLGCAGPGGDGKIVEWRRVSLQNSRKKRSIKAPGSRSEARRKRRREVFASGVDDSPGLGGL